MLDEGQRLKRLQRLNVLDTEPDRLFEDIVARALASFPGTSISAVSLVDQDRQWFKAIAGLGVRQTSRAVSFCAHTMQGEAPMVVEDAACDPRFAKNALVTDAPSIRFYAGAPLVQGVGAICVIGTSPRRATDAELSRLQTLAIEVNIYLMLHATQCQSQAQRLFQNGPDDLVKAGGRSVRGSKTCDDLTRGKVEPDYPCAA